MLRGGRRLLSHFKLFTARRSCLTNAPFPSGSLSPIKMRAVWLFRLFTICSLGKCFPPRLSHSLVMTQIWFIKLSTLKLYEVPTSSLYALISYKAYGTQSFKKQILID